MIYLTADLHLGHENIIGYCGRPFRNAHEMDGSLLSNIIETVQQTDILYVLGDFAFDRQVFDAYANALCAACRVYFIRGNHDAKQARTDGLALDFKHNHRHYYLCHYPWASWRPNTVMLHGHCHGNPIALPNDTRQHMRFDVGVDTDWSRWSGGDYYWRPYHPVSIEQIERRIESQPTEAP